MKKKQRLWAWIGVVLAGWVIVGLVVYNFWSEETWNKITYRYELKKLELRLSKVSDLHDSLTEKKKEISLTRDELFKKIKIYRKEVAQSNRVKSLNTYEKAENDQQIRLTLQLIQINLAYIAKLKQTKHVIATGNNEILFLKRKFKTDYEVATVLNRTEIKILLDEINLAIEKYMPYAGELVLNTDDIELESTKHIWQDIIKGEKRKQAELKRKEKERREKIEKEKAKRLRREEEKRAQMQREEEEQKRKKEEERAEIARQKRIDKEKRKKEEAYRRTPEGRLLGLIKTGRFSLDWYKKVTKNVHYVILSNLKKYRWSNIAEKREIYKIIFLHPYTIIEIEFQHSCGHCVSSPFVKFDRIMDKDNVIYKPLACYNSRGRKSNKAGHGSGVYSLYFVYPYIDPHKLSKGTYIMGENDFFISNFKLKGKVSPSQQSGIKNRRSSKKASNSNDQAAKELLSVVKNNRFSYGWYSRITENVYPVENKAIRNHKHIYRAVKQIVNIPHEWTIVEVVLVSTKRSNFGRDEVVRSVKLQDVDGVLHRPRFVFSKRGLLKQSYLKSVEGGDRYYYLFFNYIDPERLRQGKYVLGKNNIVVAEFWYAGTQKKQSKPRKQIKKYDFDGVWEGRGTQRGGSTWSIKILVFKNNHKIEYPSLSCGGPLTLIEQTNNSIKFKEKISFGRGRCINGGMVELILTGEDTAKYFWYKRNGKKYAEGSLIRVLK